ncbi:NAD-dependent epimerase/dehydratase [Burkholderia sp. H160]|nr:NAD-dependent epimerase/dehydratase [Burkholderia sp. H160]
MATAIKLVIGASGFLGSHVTRQLTQEGYNVRVLVRPRSDTRAIDGLPVERIFGDIFDDQVLQLALQDCDTVFYCAADARAWLRDPKPLFDTNVDGLRHVLDVAVAANLKRFVFTSSICTIGRTSHSKLDEAPILNWNEEEHSYIRSRVEAERLVRSYCLDRGLPAVTMCVANTYGHGDWRPTPLGRMVADAALGKLRFYIDGHEGEAVGVEDAAAALILAGQKGRIGERYIVSDRFISTRELFEAAAEATGVRTPRIRVSLRWMYALGTLGNILSRLLGRDLMLTTNSVRLMHNTSPMDHGKAERELGWSPRPVEEAVREAALFFLWQAGQYPVHFARYRRPPPDGECGEFI